MTVANRPRRGQVIGRDATKTAIRLIRITSGTIVMTNKRMVSLAKALADVHLGDGDMLGEWARELKQIIDAQYPEITRPDDDED